MPHPTFGVLGPLEVRLDGHVITIGSRKQRLLLCALLTAPNRVVGIDTLVALLWDDDPPASVAVTLRSVASRLRRALGPLGERVRAIGGGYLAAVDPETVDLYAFEALAIQGRQLLANGRAGEAVAALTRALALWRGPVLVDLADFAAA